MLIDDYDPDEDTRAELLAEDKAAKRYQRSLLANPDCRDPDHPGCENCRDEEVCDDHS